MGFNISGFTGDVGPLDKNSPGYASSPFVGSEKDWFFTGHVGLTADFRVSNALSIATEALVNGRGGAYKIENDNVVLLDSAGNQSTAYDTYNYELFYLEFPLLIRYHLPIQSSNTMYVIYGGVSPGFKIASNTIYNHYVLQPDSTVSTVSDKNQISNVRSFVVSPTFGFWVYAKDPDMPVDFFGDLRFEYAEMPVFNKPSENGQNLQTGMWTISFGFGVRF
jgi:hypothetical protein